MIGFLIASIILGSAFIYVINDINNQLNELIRSVTL
jgi:hypothetical protein